MSETIEALRSGRSIEIEGAFVVALGRPVQEGDLYVAERNQGPRLLTAGRIDPRGWVVPRESAYYYDVWECVAVEVAGGTSC